MEIGGGITFGGGLLVDREPDPTFTITPSTSSVNEGGSVTWTITSTNFGSGTIYYTMGGTASTSDYTPAVSSGSITITNDSGSFTKDITADYFTESVNTLIVSLRTGSVSGTVVATSSTVTINDTSTSSIVPDSTTANEGDTITWTITTSDFGSGTLYYSNFGTTVAADFTDNLNSGSITITNNTGTLTKTLANDLTTEGSQTILLRLRSGSVSGPVIATSSTVTIADTSTLPSATITPDKLGIYVGDTGYLTVTWTINTVGVGNGTLYYTNSGTTNASDFSDGLNSGSITITNDVGTLSKTIISDGSATGIETIIMQVRAVSTSGTVIATSSTVNVYDSVSTTSQIAFTTPGTYSWTCPPGVTKVSVVAVGAGGGGQCNSGSQDGSALGGGGGGGLGYTNNITVVPRTSYTVVVGASAAATSGGDSYFINTSTVKGGGGATATVTTSGGAGGTYTGTGGGNGGAGGTQGAGGWQSGAGGGAGGYSGNGGAGGNHASNGSPAATSSGGGGGGGADNYSYGNTCGSGGGGGVGILGKGTDGAGGNTGGSDGLQTGGGAGSSGTAGQIGTQTLVGAHGGAGGTYGGGGGSIADQGHGEVGGAGGSGAVRIIWPGNTRLFPSTNTGDL